jgi:heterodisulfide reductase subunit A-like polyferredoxin
MKIGTYSYQFGINIASSVDVENVAEFGEELNKMGSNPLKEKIEVKL